MLNSKKKLVVLSGAGISAESGLKTFRDSDGLWENYNVYDVATPEAWKKDPELVLRFYEARWEQVKNAEPNLAHRQLAELEKTFDVEIITQNIDDLHERAGSTKICHLHGEINLICSEKDKNTAFGLDPNLGYIKIGDKAPDGGQLRPFIVWFGEEVPMMVEAMEIVKKADILLIVGTSLQVYPAASLIHFAPINCPTYILDPNDNFENGGNFTHIKKKACEGMPELLRLLQDV